MNIIKKTYNSFMNTEKNGFEDAKGLQKEKEQLGVYTILITLKLETKRN